VNTATEVNQDALESFQAINQPHPDLNPIVVEDNVAPTSTGRRRLSDEDIQMIYDEGRVQAEQLIRRQIDNNVLPYVNREAVEVYIPQNLRNQESQLFHIIAGLCYHTRVSLIEYETSLVSATVRDSNEFLDGFLLGFYDAKPTRLDRSKKSLEQGLAFAFALKVRGELIKIQKSEWLIKNNYFFGNNPEEKIGNISVSFVLKQKIIGIFEDPKVGSAFYGILCYLYEMMGLAQFSSEDYESSILKYTIKFEDVISKFYQPVRATRKGKVQIISWRKGSKPNPSPLLKKKEFDILVEIASPLWKDLDEYKKDWSTIVLSASPAQRIETLIGRLYKARFEFLQKFGSLTTKRLQELRKLLNVANKKKAEVKPENLTALLSARPSPANHFVKEIAKCFKSMKYLLHDFEFRNDIASGNWHKVVFEDVFSYYFDENIIQVRGDRVIDQPERLEQGLKTQLKNLRAFGRRMRELSNRITSLAYLSAPQLLARKVHGVKIIIEQIKPLIAELVHLDKKDADFLISRILHIDEWRGNDLMQFLVTLSSAITTLEGLAPQELWQGNPNARRNLEVFFIHFSVTLKENAESFLLL
jgi:hypothetical protein